MKTAGKSSPIDGEICDFRLVASICELVDGRYKYWFHRIGVLLVLLSTLYGCRRELNAPGLEDELLLPILSTKLSIQEIVPDSLRGETTEGDIILSYRNEIYAASLNSFQALETREFEEVAKLQSLTLGARSAERSVSLGQVAEAEGGATGAFIISQHGSTSVIPPIPGLSYGPMPVDGSEFFETVTLDSGYMDITLQNGFPTGLSNIDFEIRNESDNSLVGSETFASVAAGGSQTRTIDLAGKTIEGQLLGNILNMDVNASSGAVLIDTSDAVIVTVTIRDMKVFSATAIFPAQDIISIADTSAMENVNDLRVSRAKAKTGSVNLRVVSTVEDTMYFNYFIPEGKKDGIPFEINASIEPAPSGGSIERLFEYSVDGYEFDLTGQPTINLYNAFYSELTGRIDSTGKVVNLSLDDSILVFVQLSDFIPEYVEGYLGNTSAEVGPESAPVDLFKHFESGRLEFEEVAVAISVVNGNGVPFSVDMESLEAVNTKKGEESAIDLSSLPDPIVVEGASDLQTPWEETWQLEVTSSLNDALNIFPDELRVALSVSSNPDMDTNNLGQFAVDSNDLAAYMDLEIPLSLIAEDLVLADTLPFEGDLFADVESVQAGTLYVVASNGLPFSSGFIVDFLDESGSVLVTADFDGEIPAASPEVESAVSWAFTEDDLEDLSMSSRAVVKARLNTLDATEYSKIRSDQAIDLTMTVRFNYNYTP